MRLLEFLEAKFTKNSIQNQAAFSAFRDGELKATQTILNFIRWVMKVVAIPKLLIEFPLALLGVVDMPESSQDLLAKLKADAEIKAKAMQQEVENSKVILKAVEKPDLTSKPAELQ